MGAGAKKLGLRRGELERLSAYAIAKSTMLGCIVEGDANGASVYAEHCATYAKDLSSTALRILGDP